MGICTSDLISNTCISLSQSTSPRALHFSNFRVLGGNLLQYELGSNGRPCLRRPVLVSVLFSLPQAAALPR
jgi:hypothetical protein